MRCTYRGRGFGVLAAVLTLIGVATADEGPTKSPGVFAAPQAEFAGQIVTFEAVRLAQSGRPDEARKRLEDAIAEDQIPAAIGHYRLACLHAAQGDAAAGLDALAAAVAAGFHDKAAMAGDGNLAPLRGDPRFADLVSSVTANAWAMEQKMQDARPRPVKDGIATVDEDNTIWVPGLSRFFVSHEFPSPDPRADVSRQPGKVGDLLRKWRKEGTAAGLHGVLYDNHDDGHSIMHTDWFPELARVEYSAAAKKAGTNLHGVGEFARGLQVLFVHGVPVIGNASTAKAGGVMWRSMPRQAMVNSVQMAMLADQYGANMLYVYPEHRDYDRDSDKGHGDVYPANVPYLVTSQGSSGSDQPFLDALAATIAAFRPETREFLVQRRLLAPTLQMILRSSRKSVKSRDDYLGGAAHPPVFDAATLDVERMVTMAHDLEPGAVPPLVRLTVEEEYLGRPGIDYFEAGPAEKLFDTTSAVARVVRSARYRRRMVAGVGATKDPNDKPLKFTWRLLRGDAKRVRIKPLDARGTRAEIVVDWHPRDTYPGSDLASARVDVGVFADNGAHLSAPAFLCWYFPPNERRTYEKVPATAAVDRKDDVNGDSPLRIVKIERLPTDSPESYVDPMAVTPANWTDTYRYDDGGDLLGWTRTRTDGDEEFTPDGKLVVDRDAAGGAARSRAVLYVRRQTAPEAMPVLEEVSGGPANR